MRSISALVVFALVAGALALSSCSSDRSVAPESTSPGGEVPAYVAPSSPENVLANLVTAHLRRDIEGYAACFADEFVFVPSPRQQVGFDRLTREDDLASTRRMFERVEAIEMRLTPGPIRPSERVDLPASDGYVETLATVSLRVRVPQPGGESLVLDVANDPAYFVFAPSTEEGRRVYRIVRQEDRH
jgi:hypothetical protein